MIASAYLQKAYQHNKKLVRMFSRGVCEVCKSVWAMQTHHIDLGKADHHPVNLLDVCDPCHKRLHHKLSVHEAIDLEARTKEMRKFLEMMERVQLNDAPWKTDDALWEKRKALFNSLIGSGMSPKEISETVNRAMCGNEYLVLEDSDLDVIRARMRDDAVDKRRKA